jgi:hypothetical protein
MCRQSKIPTKFFHIFLSLICFIASTDLSAQDEPEGKILFDKFYNKPGPPPTIRNILNKISLGVSTGYGRTFYKHEFTDMALLQKRDDRLYAFSRESDISDDEITQSYLNWFNFVPVATNVPIDRANNDFVVSSDSAEIGYKARARGIPLSFTLHYAFDRYRVGIGTSYEFHKIHEFNPISFTDSLQSFDSPVRKATFKRYFLTLGGRVYSYYDYSLMVEAQIGILKLGPNFDKSVIKKGVYFNLGASFEREFSEYFTVFVRPSFEIKSFTTNLLEGLSVPHKQSALFVNFGVYLKLPELPKCKIKNCQIQINHTHGGGKNWRSRMHPFFKKQNPHYGENYPKLLRDKRKNKKRLNPF